MTPPGDLTGDLPWYDGRVIYKSGDAAAPMAIAVTVLPGKATRRKLRKVAAAPPVPHSGATGK